MKTTERLNLPSTSPGTSRSLSIIRYGTPGSGPKVYVQAGLHADEAPGFLVAYHLEQLFDHAEIKGEIILVPVANPIGLSQWRDDLLHGRFDFVNSINFNRHHHDLTDIIADRAADLLGDDATQNVSIIRTCTAAILQEVEPEDEAEYLKKILLSLSHDADIVLDLHCDHEALMHIYMGTPLWPDSRDLAAQLGAEVTLLAKNSGGNPFDEACSRLWWDLAAKFTSHPIPPACLAATIELRGAADTDPGVARKDAENIFYFLQRRNIIEGTAPQQPQLKNEATPLTGVDYVKAAVPGIITYLKKTGDWVKNGDVIAEIITPLPQADEQTLQQVKSRTDGLLFTRNCDRFARPGRVLAKIAGKKPLRDDDSNLLTL
jgi:predicted deacylase